MPPHYLLSLWRQHPDGLTLGVGEALDIPFPSAQSVETHRIDVPSAIFPGIYQEGTIDGYLYRIYANGEAVLSEAHGVSQWTITVACPDGSCSQTTSGPPPVTTQNVVEMIQRCLLNEEVLLVDPPLEEDQPPATTVDQTPGKPAEEEPEQSLVDTPAPEQDEGNIPALVQKMPAAPAVEDTDSGEAAETTTADAPVVPPCDLSEFISTNPNITLQRLLVEAGANPGWIDGIVGPLTRRAMKEALGEREAPWEVSDAIAALTAKICEGS